MINLFFLTATDEERGRSVNAEALVSDIAGGFSNVSFRILFQHHLPALNAVDAQGKGME